MGNYGRGLKNAMMFMIVIAAIVGWALGAWELIRWLWTHIDISWIGVTSIFHGLE